VTAGVTGEENAPRRTPATPNLARLPVGRVPRITSHPRHTLTHFNLGLALARLGRIQDARRHYQAAVDLDPSFQPARRALEDAPG